MSFFSDHRGVMIAVTELTQVMISIAVIKSQYEMLYSSPSFFLKTLEEQDSPFVLSATQLSFNSCLHFEISFSASLVTHSSPPPPPCPTPPNSLPPTMSERVNSILSPSQEVSMCQ